MRVLVTGASGLIGQHLLSELLRAGVPARALVRSPGKITQLPPEEVVAWNAQEPPRAESLRGVTAVVHLAGEGIAEARWSEARKRQLVQSRLESTRQLLRAFAALPPEARPRTLLSASAIGIYGETGETVAEETTPSGRGFLAELCRDWEAAANEAASLGVRVVNLRTGLVLAREGGALAKMGPATLGSGRQWMSWIHVDDLTRFILHALAHEEMRGPYNLVAPEPARNRAFTAAFARARGYPFVIPAPAAALRLVLGEMASALLESQRVAPARTLASGFAFRHPSLAEALQNLFGETNYLDQFFSAAQFVPLPRGAVFPYFGRAENLEELTPPWLRFRIVHASTPAVERGTLIDYRLRIRGVPVRWRTLISAWNPPESFVDEQLRGPYRRWHHEHHFFSVPGGTLLRDDVTFRAPFGILGKLLLSGWIRRDIRTIFAYRQRQITAFVAAGHLK